MKIDVHLFEIETGDRAIFEDEQNLCPGETDLEAGIAYQWSDGNYSCDCNRGLFFARARGLPDPDVACGEEIYLVEKIVEHGTDRLIYVDDPSRLEFVLRLRGIEP